MTVVGAAGDIVLLRPLVRPRPADSLLPELEAADVTCANLEVPLTDEASPAKSHGIVLRGDAALVEDLAALGVGVIGLANNHVADHGWPALRGVVERVAGRGMVPVGAGAGPEEAWRPAVVGDVAFVCGNCIAPWSYDGHLAGVRGEAGDEHLLAAVRSAARERSRVVVMLHWGVPHVARAEDSQRELAQRVVEAGASVVFGCHAHVLQGVEVIDGVPVFYGLGSLVFQYAGRGAHTFERDAAVALVDLDDAGRARRAELVIGRIGPDGEAIRAHPARVERVVEHLVATGADWGAPLRQDGERVEVSLE